jgi:glycosyltransferase involved in cell wall biosynthesis
MPPRVVICRSQPINPDPRVEKISRALADGGYPVMALGWNMSGELMLEEDRDGVHIQRLPVKAEFGRGISNIPHQIRWQNALLRWLSQQRANYDIIHACDFDTVIPALIAQRLWKKIVVYDIFDFYADMLRATPTPIKRALRVAELKAIDRVDGLILADDSRFQQIAGSHPKRVAVIYNCPEEPPIDEFPDLDQRHPESLLHIAYVGNLQTQRGLVSIMKILRKHPEWSLDLAGFGGDEGEILAAASGLSNVAWHGRVSYRRSLELNRAADVLFAIYDPAILNNRYSSPNKLFEAMLLGIPIIVARGTHIDHLVEEHQIGLVINYGDDAGLEKALTSLQTDPGLRIQMGQNSRRAYETTYNWEIMKRRLLSFYEEVALS